ncbi:MAG: hypothetical protein HY890_05550 [Deltaproteobacteria bacterium]|nr:hypothetical protein [Deltaproteobacteria bacterium]
MKRLLWILPAISLIGCAGTVSKTEGARFEKTQVLEIKPGSTTREAVIAAFGQPAETSTENGAEKLVYVFKEHKTPTLFGGLVESELNAKDQTTTLEVVIKAGVVDEYRYKVAVR